jgi:Bifunctional DNA primase/polymerase, N-terminal/Primase C terminal 1 (PriCT-1)/Histidine kinase-, DNA gyrase B-, and HSP90-like ATPase
MSAPLQRTTFTTSRLLEFCSRKELVAQTGAEPDAWPMMVVKELVDNALDACEEAAVAPAIRVTIARRKIRVRDNGPGVPPETVASILDFSTRTSSREAYVAPDRGRQGNAFKTILAMPFALSGEEGKVEILARGIRHAIAFRVDRIAQQPVIEHEQHPGLVRTGTSITVHWPESSRSELEDAGPQFLPIIRRPRHDRRATRQPHGQDGGPVGAHQRQGHPLLLRLHGRLPAALVRRRRERSSDPAGRDGSRLAPHGSGARPIQTTADQERRARSTDLGSIARYRAAYAGAAANLARRERGGNPRSRAGAGPMSTGTAALALARRGAPVLPLWWTGDAGECACGSTDADHKAGKHPIGALVPHGVKDASLDPRTIESWWRRKPNANIGIATGGAMRLLVLDEDPDAGGAASLADLEREHGSLPATVEAVTPRGGRHVYLIVPTGRPLPTISAGKLGPGLDTRCAGGYVAAPPSKIGARTYSWSVDSADRFATAPAWLLERLAQGGGNGKATPPETWARLMQGVDAGARNDSIARLAGLLFRRLRASEAETAAALILAFNEARCHPPLPVEEVQRILDSIAAAEMRRRGLTT